MPVMHGAMQASQGGVVLHNWKFVERLGWGATSGVLPLRYFPGITAGLHWLITGIGFLLSIWQGYY